MCGCWWLFFPPFGWSWSFHSCCGGCRWSRSGSGSRGGRWRCGNSCWGRLGARSFFMLFFFLNLFHFNFHWFFSCFTFYSILDFLLDFFSKSCRPFGFSVLLSSRWRYHSWFCFLFSRRCVFFNKFWWLFNLLWSWNRSSSCFFGKLWWLCSLLLDRRWSRCCHSSFRFLCWSSWLFFFKFCFLRCFSLCWSFGSRSFTFSSLFLFSNFLLLLFILLLSRRLSLLFRFSSFGFLCLSRLWVWLSSLFSSLRFYNLVLFCVFIFRCIMFLNLRQFLLRVLFLVWSMFLFLFLFL